jgi:hypothetical protein
MNEPLVLGLIGVVVAGFVLWPFLRRRRGPVADGSATATRVTAARPGSAAAEELAELELDRAMGRVSEADFERWRGEIAAGAVEDDTRPLSAVEATPVDATARAEALVRRWREAARSSCPTCGERPEAEARYCSNCGASLGG